MMNGFRLVGRAFTTGLFRPGLTLGSIEEDELMAMAPALKASILDRITAEDPGEHAQLSLWRVFPASFCVSHRPCFET